MVTSGNTFDKRRSGAQNVPCIYICHMPNLSEGLSVDAPTMNPMRGWRYYNAKTHIYHFIFHEICIIYCLQIDQALRYDHDFQFRLRQLYNTYEGWIPAHKQTQTLTLTISTTSRWTMVTPATGANLTTGGGVQQGSEPTQAINYEDMEVTSLQSSKITTDVATTTRKRTRRTSSVGAACPTKRSQQTTRA